MQTRTPGRKLGAPSIMDSGTSCLVIPADNMEAGRERERERELSIIKN